MRRKNRSGAAALVVHKFTYFFIVRGGVIVGPLVIQNSAADDRRVLQ